MGKKELRQQVLYGYEPFFFNNTSVPQIPKKLTDLKNGLTESELRDFLLVAENSLFLGCLLAEIADRVDLSIEEILKRLE